MTRSEIQTRVRELSRELHALRKRLRGSPAQVFRGPTRKQDHAAKRETRREETARLRAARMEIAEGRCEGPWEWGEPCAGSPLHMHHTLGGSGRRTQQQNVENVRMLCWRHHREAHDARALALERAQRP